ncbi:MAG: SHOCT domain-containing protein [Flavobacteriales bacterium]|nr:SHOCT domain-containing protein [Flavobacteriales bacterium]
MANFELYESFQISNKAVTVEQIALTMRGSLLNMYEFTNTELTPSGVSVKGDIKGWFSRAKTKAEAKITLQGSQALIEVKGKCSIGILPWIELVLWILLISSPAGWVFFGMFVVEVLEYISSKDKPKQSFEDALKAVKHKLFQGNSSFGSVAGVSEPSTLSNLELLEKLATLRDKKIISEEEFASKKKELLKV